jgi:hypothetical protein
MQEDIAGTWGRNNVGVFMRREDNDAIKRLSQLQTGADSILSQSKYPQEAITIQVSPQAGVYYGYAFDYEVGDLVNISANKGALSFTNKKQRIYEATLSMSDNNVETVAPLVSHDFFGKFPE